MTFEEEIDRLFKPYSLEKRKAVEAMPEYQEAALKKDAAKASEIACAAMEGNFRSRESAYLWKNLRAE